MVEGSWHSGFIESRNCRVGRKKKKKKKKKKSLDLISSLSLPLRSLKAANNLLFPSSHTTNTL